jgi:hypothetical protein
MMPSKFSLPDLDAVMAETALRTDLIAIIDSGKWPLRLANPEKYLPHLAFHIASGAVMPPDDVLKKMRFVEFEDSGDIRGRIREIKGINPGIVAAVRVTLNSRGIDRAIVLAGEGLEAIHVVADINGNEISKENPVFIKDIIRKLHTSLIQKGTRDEVTIIAGGGIALPEHMAKAVICGADLVSVDLPLLIGLECHLCEICEKGRFCPAKLQELSREYGAGRMTNLISAWHGQLIELMGAMGMRDARRLRGDAGRAMFFEQLEEETFGKLFGTRIRS